MVSQKVGGWAFILGVVIAIIAGLAATFAAMYSGYVLLVLVVLGLIVGFLNIKDKQVVNFLIAAITLMAVGTANLVSINLAIPLLGSLIMSIVQNVAAFVAPAALVVALKEVYNIAKE
jgi:uncharacterized membrane protein YccC